jgi:transcriptional regulator with XRE-family HTH domain
MFEANLREVRTKMGISQGEMAKSLKMLQSQYSNYERGISKPSFEVLEKLVKLHNININYLLTGKGAMFITSELEKDLIKFTVPAGSKVLLDIE